MSEQRAGRCVGSGRRHSARAEGWAHAVSWQEERAAAGERPAAARPTRRACARGPPLTNNNHDVASPPAAQHLRDAPAGGAASSRQQQPHLRAALHRSALRLASAPATPRAGAHVTSSAHSASPEGGVSRPRSGARGPCAPAESSVRPRRQRAPPSDRAAAAAAAGARASAHGRDDDAERPSSRMEDMPCLPRQFLGMSVCGWA